MKRFLCLVLALALPLPAFGAEKAGFSDVHPGDWFVPYVEVCVDRGLMKGTGEGRFSPEAALNYAECMTLAWRLYDIQRGGDGSVETAPEDWGRLVLTAQDGTVIRTYTGDVSRGWNAEGWHLGIPLEKGLETWGREIAPGMTGTLSVEGATYEGIFCQTNYFEDPLTFTISDDGIEELWEQSIPGPGSWWRDVCYTIEKRGLAGVFDLDSFSEAPAVREFFAARLADGAGELKGINEIPSLPDCADEQVLSLYRAGILTGFDPSGTFHGQAALSRSEAAAMMARVLEPSLRLSFSPQPLPTVGYTLTYLMDGSPDCGITYPVCALSGWAEVSGLLTLDGRLLPWPEGSVPSYGLEEMGAYVKIAVYKDPTKLADPYSTSPGMMDASGDWVIAPGTYDLIWPVEGGFCAWATGDWATWQGYRLDLKGQVVEELGTADGEPEPPGGWENYTVPDLRSWDGLKPHSHGVTEGAYYVSFDGTAASQMFDWAGAIGPDGRGFAGMDGKIYRIEFER